MAVTLHRQVGKKQVPLTIIAHYTSPCAQNDAENTLEMWVSSCIREHPNRPLIIIGDFNRPVDWVRSFFEGYGLSIMQDAGTIIPTRENNQLDYIISNCRHRNTNAMPY